MQISGVMCQGHKAKQWQSQDENSISKLEVHSCRETTCLSQMRLGQQNRCEWCRLRGLLQEPSPPQWRMLVESLRGYCSESTVGQNGRRVSRAWSWEEKEQGQIGIHEDKFQPAYPLLHPQPCGWLAGRSWQPLPPSHTRSWPRPHKVEGDRQEARQQRPSCCPRPPRELADQQTHGELHLAPYIDLVGVMAIASLPSSKSHTNFSCGQP